MAVAGPSCRFDAATCSKAGRPVVVLEARERAGGRVLTIRAPFADGLHAEAGPSRIAGVHQAVLKAARAFGLTLTPYESSQGSSVVAINGRAATAEEIVRGALTLDLKPEERALVPAALLDRYVGTRPTIWPRRRRRRSRGPAGGPTIK